MVTLYNLRRARQFGAALLLTLAGAVSASALDEVDDIFLVTGLDSTFAKGPEMAGDIAAELGADPATTALWAQAAEETLDPGQLSEAFRTHFLEEFEPDLAPDILQFRRSPLGEAITKAETEINLLSSDVYETRRIAAEAAFEGISEKRDALYDRLAELTGALQSDAHLVALVEALITPLLPQDEVAATLETLRSSLADEPEHLVSKRTVIVTYEQFSDAELHTYIEHLESPASRAFHRAVQTGEDRVFTEAVKALSSKFAASVGQQ